MIAISLCVLLLATYCYSVPVNPRFGVTTPSYEYTTGRTMVRQNNNITMHLMTDAESTGVPDLHRPRTYMGSDSSEYTTSMPHGVHMNRVPRVLAKSSVPTATMYPAESVFIHNFNKFHFTTMENKSQFQKKAIGPTETESAEERETETELKRDVPEKDLESKEEEESKRDVRESDAESKEEEEAKRDVRENDAESQEAEEESKRDVPEKESESKEEESKRELRESGTESEEESKRELRENDTESEEESKRDLRENDTESKEEESESKRAMFGKNFEATTSFLSGSPSATYKSINSSESREHSREQPSSVDSFGKTTGLLRKQPVGVRSGKPLDRSSEEFTTSSQMLHKPVKVTGSKYSV